jgi:hypothetical protein
MQGFGLGLGLSQRGRGGRSVVSLASLKADIVKNDSDVHILVIGDSTGNDSAEWVHRVAVDFGSRFTEMSVQYSLYDSVSDAYGAAETISTGSGPHTIHLWNASIAGANFNTLRGSKFGPSIGALDPNLIVFNLGHNTTGLTATPSNHRGNLMAMVEQVMIAHRGVPQVMILQNPRRDTDLMAPVIASQKYFKTLRPEMGLIDVYSEFIARNKDPSLYADDTHPSYSSPGSDGQTLFVNRWWKDFDSAAGALPAGAFTPWLDQRASVDLATNGDFAVFTGAVPDQFTAMGAGLATSKETTIVAPGKPYSLKVVNGSTVSHIRQDYSTAVRTAALNALKGKKATLAVHHYIASAAVQSPGMGRTRLLVEPPASSGVIQDNSGSVGLDGWRWDIISGLDIPADANLIWIMDYPNSAGDLGNGTVYIDEMRLFVGEIPGAPA